MDKKYTLRLYLAGIAPDSQDLIVTFKDGLSHKIGNDFSIEVVDILEQPHIAEEDHILATPTVVRVSPAPSKKIILNLNNESNLEFTLELLTEE